MSTPVLFCKSSANERALLLSHKAGEYKAWDLRIWIIPNSGSCLVHSTLVHSLLKLTVLASLELQLGN